MEPGQRLLYHVYVPCIPLLWGTVRLVWYSENRTDGTDGTGELKAHQKI